MSQKYKNLHKYRSKKAIVFDLDQTLGDFSELGTFWDLVKKYFKDPDLDIKYFFSILENEPLFLRPQLIELCRRLKRYKKRRICDNVIIFTNNTAPDEWCAMIRDYIHYKLGYRLFDQIIRAFKINGKTVEICRTSQSKSYKDFINCSHLPQNTRVCFFDDIMHHNMRHPNVDYIKLEPYYYKCDFREMATKFYKINEMSIFKNTNKTSSDFCDYIKEYSEKSNSYFKREKVFRLSDEIHNTKNMMRNIDKFLNVRMPPAKTKKHNYKNKGFRRQTQKS